MNNNDLYIKMVLALPDSFFNGWQWKNGDRYVILHPNGQISDDYIADVDCWKFDSDLNIRPLPSQRQLQDMILTHWQKTAWHGYTYFQVFSEFWNNYVLRDENRIKSYLENKTTPEEMLLMFLMHDLYNQEWDGEMWL